MDREKLEKIIHYSYRIEFQQRGSPNAHSVLWDDNAPTLNDSYKDRPSEKKRPRAVQPTYNCRTTPPHSNMQKKGTNCRFGFP